MIFTILTVMLASLAGRPQAAGVQLPECAASAGMLPVLSQAPPPATHAAVGPGVEPAPSIVRSAMRRMPYAGLRPMAPWAAKPRTAQAAESARQAQQQVYRNEVFLPEIRTVQFQVSGEEGSLPVLDLAAGGVLELSFDDLRGGYRNFYYTIEHCTAEWQSSGLPQIQYLKGFPGERIADYQTSFNTFQEYTNYRLQLPNTAVQPLIPGNYILKVYEDNDPENLVLTRRFYMLATKVGIEAEFRRSSKPSERDRNQKLNFTILHPNLAISNPFGEIKVLVQQNGREDNAQWVSRPVFVRGSQLVYDAVDVTDFSGGNEFRRVDLRSVRFRGEGVADIRREDGYGVTLETDEARQAEAYASLIDYNGRYFIRFLEGNAPELEADYVRTLFRLSAPQAGGAYYVFGALSDWQLKEEFRMEYDAASGFYEASPLLKQGLYDYLYLYADPSGRTDLFPVEGSHYETENDYYIFVYHRRVGSRYDELVGFRKLNTGELFR